MTMPIAASTHGRWQRMFFAGPEATDAFRPAPRSEADAILRGNNVPPARVVISSAEHTLGGKLYRSERENIHGKLHWMLTTARFLSLCVR